MTSRLAEHPLLLLVSPDRRALQFAIKGLVAMALALFLALLFGLERPYWALISAILLQIRPETGLVIEKGLCQILGTLVGGATGIIILATLLPHPLLAITVLALWVAINAGASAWVRQANFIYGFAMAGVTATLIVVLPIANPGSETNMGIFHIATARVSEIVLGALCASVVSALLWPGQVGTLLFLHSRNTLNHTLAYLELELSPHSTHNQRHQQADSLLQAVFALNDDSSAAYYESSQGKGKARAATLICNRVLALLARSRIFGRLQRYHQEQISAPMADLFSHLHQQLVTLRETQSLDHARELAQRLRQDIKERQQQAPSGPPLEQRVMQTAQQLIADLVVALDAHQALLHSDTKLLRPPALKPYRDWLMAAVVGLRATLVFLSAAILWIGTGSTSAVLVMIMPVIFTILFARLPAPQEALAKATIGALLALPVALFFTLPLLALSSADFPLLLMIFGAPLFLGLLAISQRQTLHYGLGFCTPYIILVQPGNSMVFAIEQAVSGGMAIILGLLLANLMFRLITPPKGALLRNRLLRQTAADLRELSQSTDTLQEQRFNARMADRLRWLAEADKSLPEGQRHYTDLGLTALNLGHVSVWVERQLQHSHSDWTQMALKQWQQALADAWQGCGQGIDSDQFEHRCNQLLAALAVDPELDDRTLDQIAGSFTRLILTFRRLAPRFAPAR